jgi:hypothetical protein
MTFLHLRQCLGLVHLDLFCHRHLRPRFQVVRHQRSCASLINPPIYLFSYIHCISVINTQRAAIKMEEERSPTKSDYDSSYPVRPSMSRSSSVSSFLGRQGFDRYGDEWGGGALTLIGKLPHPSIMIKLMNRCC